MEVCFLLSKYFFKQKEKEIKENMKNEINNLRYWKKFAIECQNNQGRNIQKFRKEFPHKNELDDELKIEAYAAEFGYEIIDEDIKADKTIYTFQYKSTSG